MRAAIEFTENIDGSNKNQPATISHNYSTPSGPSAFTVTAAQPVPTAPIIMPTTKPKPAEKAPENPAKIAAMQQLATNKEYSVATIAKEASRIEQSKDGEIYIALH